MDAYTLNTEVRADGQRAGDVRSNKRIPAVYYGTGQKNAHLSVDYEEFRKTFEKAGESSIIQLKMGSKAVPVLVHEIQRHPVSDQFSHIDFIYVNMDKEVTTHVPVKIVGVSPAVKDLGGVLNTHKHEVEIRCLPKDLIHDIEVDISGLAEFFNSIHVKELKVPETIKILDDPDDTVVNVTPPRAEEVEVKPAEAVEGEAVAGAEGAAGVAGTEGAASTPGAEGAGKEGAQGAQGAAKKGAEGAGKKGGGK